MAIISVTSAHSGAHQQIRGSVAEGGVGVEISHEINQSAVHEHRGSHISPGARADAGFQPANTGSDNTRPRDRDIPSSRFYSASTSLDNLRLRSRKDTAAELLESMITQMGGAPTSTFKGMYVDLVI